MKKPAPKTMTIMVALNGTDHNPWHRLGLKQNPFPQTGKAEWDGACLRMQSLGGDPIPAPAEPYIRERLKGFTDEFVDGCVARFERGQYVTFEVEFPL